MREGKAIMKMIICAKYYSQLLEKIDIGSFECDLCICDGFTIDL